MPEPRQSSFSDFVYQCDLLSQLLSGNLISYPVSSGPSQYSLQPAHLRHQYAGLWSGAVRLSVSTYDIQPKRDLCADTICGVSGYLGTTFHLHLLTFLHSICAAETLNR